MQHQMVKIVFVVLLVMIIKMSRIDKTIKVAQTEGESLLASSALNVLSLQQQVRRSELSLLLSQCVVFHFHFLNVLSLQQQEMKSKLSLSSNTCLSFCVILIIGYLY